MCIVSDEVWDVLVATELIPAYKDNIFLTVDDAVAAASTPTPAPDTETPDKVKQHSKRLGQSVNILHKTGRGSSEWLQVVANLTYYSPMLSNLSVCSDWSENSGLDELKFGGKRKIRR